MKTDQPKPHTPLTKENRVMWRASVLNNPVIDERAREDMLRLLDDLDAKDARIGELHAAIAAMQERVNQENATLAAHNAALQLKDAEIERLKEVLFSAQQGFES